IFTAVSDSQPLSIGEPFIGANITSNWIGNTFSIEYKTSGFYSDDFKISGTLSEDAKILSSMTVFVKDTGGGTQKLLISYGYSVSNMKLIAVTDKFLVFKISGDDMKNALQNLFLTGPISSI